MPKQEDANGQEAGNGETKAIESERSLKKYTSVKITLDSCAKRGKNGSKKKSIMLQVSSKRTAERSLLETAAKHASAGARAFGSNALQHIKIAQPRAAHSTFRILTHGNKPISSSKRLLAPPVKQFEDADVHEQLEQAATPVPASKHQHMSLLELLEGLERTVSPKAAAAGAIASRTPTDARRTGASKSKLLLPAYKTPLRLNVKQLHAHAPVQTSAQASTANTKKQDVEPVFNTKVSRFV